jgi:hypothetical protein
MFDIVAFWNRHQAGSMTVHVCPSGLGRLEPEGAR